MQKATFSASTDFCSTRSPNQGSENSVLALLSGPSPLLQYGFIDFPEPIPFSKSAKLPLEGYNVTHGAPSGNMAQLNFGGSALNVVNGENLSGYSCPLVSPMVMSKPNRSGNSAFHHGIPNADMDVYQSDLARAVVNNTIPTRKDMLDFSCSGNGPYGTSFEYYENLHSSTTRICQKFPLQTDDRAGHFPSVSFSGCPRVCCLRMSDYATWS